MISKKQKNILFSPDCSENPLWAGVQPTKIATESGTIFPETQNLSAPKIYYYSSSFSCLFTASNLAIKPLTLACSFLISFGLR